MTRSAKIYVNNDLAGILTRVWPKVYKLATVTAWNVEQTIKDRLPV